MSIQDIYNDSKNEVLFNESKEFTSLRNNLLNNFNLSIKNKKNNESLKHLDPHVLDFSYKYKSLTNKIAYLEYDEDRIKIDVSNGKIQKVWSNTNNSNITFSNIDSKNNLIKDKFLYYQNYLKDDYIFNLNSLMLNSGYEININEGENTSIYISNSIKDKDLTVFQKNIINCSENSKVFLLEECTNEKKSNNNIVNFINLEKSSKVTHLIFQKNDKSANMQSTSYTNCKSNAHYKQVIVNISQGSTRNHHYANLNGEDSSADLDGVFFGANEQFIDNKTQINHNFPNCVSSQRYKGILTDQSKASYLSKTFVDKIAQKTEAYQLSKGILLSDNSYFHSKPELRIFADDVKCSHGSTIGPIDKDLLFYLRSRGLDKKKSVSLLIKSFFHDIISNITNKDFVDKFNDNSNIWLRENNI